MSLFSFFKKPAPKTIDDILDAAAQQAATDTATWMLFSGDFTKGEVAEQLARLAPEKLRANPLVDDYASKVVDEVCERHTALAKGWAEPTDHDRLMAAFAALKKLGVEVRESWGGTQSEAEVMLCEEMYGRGQLQFRFAFFHEQDTERAVLRGGLMLSFGFADLEAADDEPVVPAAETIDTGEMVMAALRAEGLKPEWNGEADRRIEMPSFRFERKHPGW